MRVAIYKLLAKYRLWRKYPRGAVIQYQRIVSIKPESRDYRYRLAELQYQDHQYDASLKTLNQLKDSRATSTLRVKNLIKLEEYEEADKIIKGLLDQGNLNYDALKLLGDFEIIQDNLKKAGQRYDELLRIADTNQQKTDSLHVLGYINEALHKDKKAREYYNELMKITDDKKVLRLGVGYLHQKRGWYEAARVAYEQYLKNDDKNADIYYELGRVYRHLKNEDAAVDAFANFVKYDPTLTKEGHRLDRKQVVFDAFMGKKYADSPKEIFEYMLHDKKYKDYTFVWILGKSVRKFWRFYLNPRVKIVPYGTKEYFRSYARAKYWVTNSRLQLIQKTHSEQVYLQCWHGTPLKRLGHDILTEGSGENKYTNDEISKQYDDETKKLDYFVSPSQFASNCFRSAFALDKFGKTNAIIEEGYPRNDPLVNTTDRDIQRLRKKYQIPRGKKTILYAPTWRDDSREDGRYVYKPVTDFDYLRDKLSDEWVILFRPHYFIANTFNFRKYEGFIYDVSDIEDINELYLISDVLMTDYSSVFFDYANLKRSMIFYMYDLEHYAKDLRGFYLDLKTLPGDIVKTEKEIVGILKDTLKYEEKHQKQYQAFHDKFNYLDDGEATKRVAGRIFTNK